MEAVFFGLSVSAFRALDETGSATREQDTRENSNRRQSVLPRCQQVLTPSE